MGLGSYFKFKSEDGEEYWVEIGHAKEWPSERPISVYQGSPPGYRLIYERVPITKWINGLLLAVGALTMLVIALYLQIGRLDG